MGRQAANQIKGAKFTEMKNIGHFPATENYELCKEYLMPIFREIAGN
jgi:pimeloyl-ACP methyl ester carboxylesterase